MTAKGRHRRDRQTPLRGTAVALGAVVAAATTAATAAPASAETGAPAAPSTSADSFSVGLDSLQRRAADLEQRVRETYAAYQSAQSQATELRGEAARADAASEQASQYANHLYGKLSGRSAVPGLGRVLGVLRGGDPELEEAVEAVKAQDAAMKAAADAAKRSAAAAQAAAAAKASWTEATAQAARLEVRILAQTVAEQSLRLARFDSSYRVPLRVQDLRNRAALENWRAYLTELADARIVPPAASRLADPGALPAPLEPVLDGAGKPVPGIAQVWRIGADPLVVLPAETIRAVTKAFTLVGRPDAARAAGPDAYACGVFTHDVWRAAGYRLPRESVAQWQTLARGTDRRHPQVGDLVYLGDRHYGIHRAGVSLGRGLWIAVNSATGEVAVEALPATGVYAVRRPTLPRPDPLTWVPATLPGWTRTGCGEGRAPIVATAQGGITPTTTTTALTTTAAIAAGAALTMPIAEGSYQLSTEFGASGPLWSGQRHTGQDFAAAVGTPVRAALAGVVTVEHPAWAGTLVRIQHGDGLETWYAHLSAVSVQPGQRVSAGTAIGAVGNAGNSTGPHLHFEVRVDGLPVDPLPLLMPATSAARWGGYRNGTIPAAALCAVTPGSAARLRCDAAVAFRLMDAAYAARFGRRMSVTDAYRSLAEQQVAFAEKPGLAAVPGTSNHGWGLALDLAGGVERFGTPEHQWVAANAPRFGWQHPAWARQGGNRPEPWHFEYGQFS